MTGEHASSGVFLQPFGGGGGIWSHLCSGPVPLHFIGASVTAQREGWADRLSARLCADTHHAHRVTKNAMGGVGLLFGVANHVPPPPADAGRGVAFIEFSTGDLNLGLTPLAQLPDLLRALVERTLHDYRYTVIVHNWRADQPVDDHAGIRQAYDRVAVESHIPVIYNQAMAQARIDVDASLQSVWFRDVCHTHPPGAQAYAEHVLDCLRHLEHEPRGDAVARERHNTPSGEPIAFVQVPPPSVELPGVRRSTYVYPGTGQSFDTAEIEAGKALNLRCTGRLMGLGFISGPRAGWVELSVDGQATRRFRCFDRHSHYERYILLPAYLDLRDTLMRLACADEPIDRTLPAKSHPDFDAPRTVTVVNMAGVGLSIEQASIDTP